MRAIRLPACCARTTPDHATAPLRIPKTCRRRIPSLRRDRSILSARKIVGSADLRFYRSVGSHGRHAAFSKICTRAGKFATTRIMTSPSFSRERLGLLLGFVGMVIFGGTLPATRIAVSAIDPIALTSLRAALAGLCSLVLLVVLRRPLPPRALWPQLVIAMLCVVILF